jgi:hypothetical protein
MALRRGDVVTSGAQNAVVWVAWPDRLLLIPTEDRPSAQHRHDVPIESIADQIACRVRSDSVLRVDRTASQRPDGWYQVGRITPDLVSHVAGEIVRAAEDASVADRWRGHDRHRAWAAAPGMAA